MIDLVGHHHLCNGCGYDLFQQPLGGSCPECGKAISRSKRLTRRKNPKRVNAGLRSSIKAWERSLRVATCMTIALVAVAMLMATLKAPLWTVIFFGLAAIIGVVSIFVCRGEIARAKDRILPVATQREHAENF